MASLFLGRLKADERKQLIEKLHGIQHGKCFICEQAVDLQVQKDDIDIDHVVPLSVRGKDDPVNFALAHASCNRSKQASNLEVARVLHRFKRLKDSLSDENRSPNLGDILAQAGGGSDQLGFKIENDVITYSFGALDDNTLRNVPVFKDGLSGFRYFFAELPIQYLAHDDHINPRSIGPNISKLVEEFYQKRPQLHVPLGWLRSVNGAQPPPKFGVNVLTTLRNNGFWFCRFDLSIVVLPGSPQGSRRAVCGANYRLANEVRQGWGWRCWARR